MNSTRKDVLALLGSLAMTVAAFLLLTYGRRNEVAAILVFGYALDAIATTGVVGNLIVFGLSKLTRWNPVRIALGTFLVLNAVPALVLLIVGNRIDPHFNHAATLTGYVVSFFFWFGLHWFWSRANMQPQVVD